MRIACARFLAPILFGSSAVALPPAVCQAQAAPQTYGVCAYTLDDTEYFSNVFGTATSYEGPANRAFREYATAQAAGKPLKMASCRFLRTETAAKDLKETDKRLLGMTGHAQKSAETGWQFTTVAVQTTTTTTTTVQPTVPPTASTAAATYSGGRVARQTARNTSTTAAATVHGGTPSTAAATSANGVSTASGTPAATSSSTGMGSIAATTTDTLKGAQTTTTTAVTNSVNGITTTTVNGLTASATGMMTNLQSRLFNRKKKSDTATIGTAPATPAVTTTVATTDTPQANGSTPVQVVTTTTLAGGMGFYFCHLKADGSDYHSGIFPGTATDQNNATVGFWKQVAHQYKISSIPFSGNVSCSLSPSEAEANAQLKSWEDGAAQRGTAGHVVDTAWTYMGN